MFLIIRGGHIDVKARHVGEKQKSDRWSKPCDNKDLCFTAV